VQCVNTVSVVRRNLINIAHFNSARDFSTAIKSRTARARGNSSLDGVVLLEFLRGSVSGSNEFAAPAQFVQNGIPASFEAVMVQSKRVNSFPSPMGIGLVGVAIQNL
jgi:hypothetical protein